MRTITGTVTSNKMDKTIVVSVDTYKSHPKYHKKYKVTKKLPAGLKWQNNSHLPYWGDPKAKRGGTFSMAYQDYPLTFRPIGPDANSQHRSNLYTYGFFPLVDIK